MGDKDEKAYDNHSVHLGYAKTTVTPTTPVVSTRATIICTEININSGDINVVIVKNEILLRRLENQ